MVSANKTRRKGLLKEKRSDFKVKLMLAAGKWRSRIICRGKERERVLNPTVIDDHVAKLLPLP